MTQVIRMRGANGQGVKLKKFEDLILPCVDGVDPQIAAQTHSTFLYKHGDILMCSYPKCGFHWIRSTLEKLKSPKDSDRPRDMLIELERQEEIDNQAEPRIMNTHVKPGRLNPSLVENKGKIILFFRNPKDVAVSYYYHFKNASLIKSKQSWDEFFESFIEEEVLFGSYFDYIKEWEEILKSIHDGKSNMRVEVFYYEDVVLKPKENIARMNKFLGFSRDENYLQRVLKETTIGALQEHYNQNVNIGNPLIYDDEGKTVISGKAR